MRRKEMSERVTLRVGVVTGMAPCSSRAAIVRGMPETKRTDFLGRLADLGEEAVHRIGDAPGGERVVGILNGMRDRLDELRKRVRGLEELEKRLDALERRVDSISPAGASSAPARKATATKSSSGPRAKSENYPGQHEPAGDVRRDVPAGCED